MVVSQQNLLEAARRLAFRQIRQAGVEQRHCVIKAHDCAAWAAAMAFIGARAAAGGAVAAEYRYQLSAAGTG
jgi:hypothetical protein